MLREMTFYRSDTVGNPSNSIYPHARTVKDADALEEVVAYDHVTAEYLDNQRSNQNFIRADCVVLDCDNDHSDDPKDWVTPEHFAAALPDVMFYAVFSRNHMKEKGGKTARPRCHMYCPSGTITDPEQYAALKRAIAEVCPYFDKNALDSARFIFGVENPQVEVFEGTLTIDEFLAANNPGADRGADADADGDAYVYADADEVYADTDRQVIPQGTRNSSMSHISGRIVKRYGNTDEAHRLFLEEAKRCDPPLDNAELHSIWASAVRFGEKVAAQPGYIPPSQFNQPYSASAPAPSAPLLPAPNAASNTPQLSVPNATPNVPPSSPPNASSSPSPDFALCPRDFTDIGQAEILVREYGNILRYSDAFGWLVYDGSVFEESDAKAQRIAQTLTERQFKEADAELTQCTQALKANGAWSILETTPLKQAMKSFSPSQKQAYEEYERALNYHKHVLKSRDTRYITAVLKEARPMLYIESSGLDADAYLLNTPSATYNLKTGEEQPHIFTDFITKKTAVDPSDDGVDFWEDALHTFFCGDRDLIEYAQDIVGLAAIGKVLNEVLIIAHGGGKNGKSTFWNSIARVLGTYTGHMSAETLTVSRINHQPEMAELKGKRLVIAAELEDGVRLNTSRVKQLCSTDKIFAAKKYHQPTAFTPSHTAILYTNHLPRVGALDAGTWRRLQVLPFDAQISETADVKNYGDFLFENAGGAILQWVIDGAKRIIAKNYKLTPPPVVQNAIQRYRDSQNWLARFIEECCEVDASYEVKSGELVTAYRAHSQQLGEFARSSADFSTAIESAGFTGRKTRNGKLIRGLRLKPLLPNA